MNKEDYEDLITILTFAKTKLDRKNKAHQLTARKIEELINKIYVAEADLLCERY